MFDPERPLEPPEAPVLAHCEDCGADICEGDDYYDLPGSYVETYRCENCAEAWLAQWKRTARKEDTMLCHSPY